MPQNYIAERRRQARQASLGEITRVVFTKTRETRSSVSVARCEGGRRNALLHGKKEMHGWMDGGGDDAPVVMPYT